MRWRQTQSRKGSRHRQDNSVSQNGRVSKTGRSTSDFRSGGISERIIGMSEDQVTLFCTNGDGTVDCAWCGETFNADLAQPDSSDDPICPECFADCEEENMNMSKEEYIENLYYSDGDLTPEQLEAEWAKFSSWKEKRVAEGANGNR